MADATRRYADVADKFGVSIRAVEMAAKNPDTVVDDQGNPTTWAILRKDLGRKASEVHEEKLVQDAAKRNEAHADMWRVIQHVALKKLVSIENGVPLTDDRGKGSEPSSWML
jgi:hypothetical protein